MSGANMPTPKRRLGAAGEDAAAAYLERCGYRILERNWRCRYGEIDLVVSDGDQIVFVEVRARRDGHALESVTLPKRRRLITLAYEYLAARALPATTLWRIDVIAVKVSGQRITDCEHLIAAVEDED